MIKKNFLYMISKYVVILFITNVVSGCASSSKKVGDEPFYKETPQEQKWSTPSVIGIVKDSTTYEAFDGGPLHREPKIKYYMKPDYPILARQACIEGDAILEVVIGKTGKVEDAKIIEEKITPSMEKSLLEAAYQFKYRPGRRRNQSIKCVGRHLIRFTLNGDAVRIEIK